MTRALVIDDNLVLSRAICDRLKAVGFDACDQVWTESQAIQAAQAHAPDVIVVGDTVAGASAERVARRLALASEAPVLVVATDEFMLRKFASLGPEIDGPHLLSELEAVLASARFVV